MITFLRCANCFSLVGCINKSTSSWQGENCKDCKLHDKHCKVYEINESNTKITTCDDCLEEGVP